MLAKLSKKQEAENEDVDAATKDRTEELRKSIAAMKSQIAGKEVKEQEREHSKKSHGTRFLERQRLTRMEKSVRKKKGDHSQELLQIAMDQIYVAHYPLQKPYRPLFKNKQRWLHHSVSRAQLRQTIAQDIQEKKVERVNWISEEQYARVPTEWSVALEVDVFDYPKGGKAKERKTSTTDSRFSMSSNHDALLEAADKVESKMARKENKKESQSNNKKDDDIDTEGSSDDSSDEDEKIQTVSKATRPTKRKRDSESDSSDGDSDSSVDEADPLQRSIKPPVVKQNAANKPEEKQDKKVQGDCGSDSTSDESSSSNSSSSSSSSSDDDDNDDDDAKPSMKTIPNKNAESEPKDNGHSDSDDDFFVAAKASKEDDIKVFELVKEKSEHRLPAENPAKGDKSKGWATQEQRPGRYKKKRERW